jgi:hypothetical protein
MTSNISNVAGAGGTEENNTHALAHEKLGVGDTRDIKLKSELILFKDIHCESYFCCVHSYTCYMRV